MPTASPERSRGPVGGIILAGGAGRRAAPRDKLLAPGPDGRPMIAHTLAQARASRLDAVLLVLGHEAARIRAACPDAGWVVAADHAEGLAASVRCGISAAARAGWRAALVCLGDMPLVGPGVIDRLLDAYRAALRAPDAAVPLARGVPGNPVLWDRRTFPRLGQLSGDAGARTLLEQGRLDCLRVETGDAAVLADFDTPERLAAFARGQPPRLPPPRRPGFQRPAAFGGSGRSPGPTLVPAPLPVDDCHPPDQPPASWSQSMAKILRTDPAAVMSRAVEYHGFVFTQGVVARDLSQGVAGQARDVLEQLDALLEQHGTDSTRILQAQIWLKHIGDRDAFNALWQAWLPAGEAPARACVQAVLADPRMLVEVMLITTK